MSDVVQLRQLGGVIQNTKKWKRGKAPKEEIRLNAVQRLATRLKEENVAAVIVEQVYEHPAPVVAPVVEPVHEVVVEVAAAADATPIHDFPDELLTPPAPTEQVPEVELPLELPEEAPKPKKKKKSSEEPANPIVLDLADKAENTLAEAPNE